MEAGDLADFSPLLSGEKTLEDLRAASLNTEVVKKLKYTKDGPEIELRDRAGADVDRISDRTDGKPKLRRAFLGRDRGALADLDRLLANQ